MNISEAIIIGIITTIGSIIGGGIMVLVSWRKAPSEIQQNEANSGKSEAEASETWARSNQLAAQQIVVLQTDVASLRTIVSRHEGRIFRLENQVRTLGAVPVE